MGKATIVMLLHILAVVHLGAAGVTIRTKPYSEHQEEVGTDIVLDCDIAGSDFSPYVHQIIWYKTARDGSLVQINTMPLVNEPFKSTGRYSVAVNDNTRQEVDPSIALKLSISKIELADDGTFTCKLLDENGQIASIEHTLLVPATPENLTLYTNNTRVEPPTEEGEEPKVVLDFEALVPSFVQCKSVGGNPMPTLHMHRDDVDITNEFIETTEELVEGEKGLEVVTYVSELVTSEFRAERDDGGKQLKCAARLPKSVSNAKNYRQTKSGVMEVTYPPHFHCEGHAYAFLGTENFTIDCKVTANPPIEIESILWVVGEFNGTNITTNANGTLPGLLANITADPEDKNAVHISLTIAMVNETAYKGYSLIVKNSMATKHHQIYLSHATTTPPTTTTKKPVKPKTKPGKGDGGAVGAVGGPGDGAGTIKFSFSLLALIFVTSALSW